MRVGYGSLRLMALSAQPKGKLGANVRQQKANGRTQKVNGQRRQKQKWRGCVRSWRSYGASSLDECQLQAIHEDTRRKAKLRVSSCVFVDSVEAPDHALLVIGREMTVIKRQHDPDDGEGNPNDQPSV